jgi:hypothetical protein
VPVAPPAGCLEPASPPPLQAAAQIASSSTAAAERRVMVNESLRRDEVERRGSRTSFGNVLAGAEKQQS